MVDLYPKSVAVGTIFPYQEAVTLDNLASFLRDRGYQINDPTEQGLNVTPQGVQVGPNPVFAEKNEIVVLSNPNAELDGYPESSFVTFRSDKTPEFDTVLDSVSQFWEEYDEFDVYQEASMVELTYQGRVSVDRSKHNMTNYLASSRVSSLEESFGTGAECAALRLESSESTTQDGWYRLLLDTKETNNPRRWGFKLNWRKSDYNDISKTVVDKGIKSIVEKSSVSE